jgi:hypothetical protein
MKVDEMKFKLIMVVCLAFIYASIATGSTRLEENAEKLVSQYLAALIQGDTEFLLGSIGGDLLASRKALLKNPDYSGYLSRYYAGATASVTGCRQLTANRAEVDVVIDKSDEEHLNYTFLVEVTEGKGKERKLLIVIEQDGKSLVE